MAALTIYFAYSCLRTKTIRVAALIYVIKKYVLFPVTVIRALFFLSKCVVSSVKGVSIRAWRLDKRESFKERQVEMSMSQNLARIIKRETRIYITNSTSQQESHNKCTKCSPMSYTAVLPQSANREKKQQLQEVDRIERRGVTSRYHSSTISGWQQNQRRRRRQGER